MTKPPPKKRSEREGSQPARAVAQAILAVITAIPTTTEPPNVLPQERARAIQISACLRAAAVSGTLSLPPGPLAIFTILPDLVAVWRIQLQMVADIAGAFGKTASLTQEQILYCLFRHAGAQIVRDLVIRVGQRVVIKRATLRTLQTITAKLGVNVSQRVLAKSVSRFLPVVGALGVAGYAYYDTAKVGSTATELFANDMARPW